MKTYAVCLAEGRKASFFFLFIFRRSMLPLSSHRTNRRALLALFYDRLKAHILQEVTRYSLIKKARHKNIFSNINSAVFDRVNTHIAIILTSLPNCEFYACLYGGVSLPLMSYCTISDYNEQNFVTMF